MFGTYCLTMNMWISVIVDFENALFWYVVNRETRHYLIIMKSSLSTSKFPTRLNSTHPYATPQPPLPCGRDNI